MRELFISPIFQILTIIISSTVAWHYGGKAKVKRELTSSDLDNEIKSANYYKGLLDDMSSRLENAIKEIGLLETRVLQLMQANRELIDKNNKLIDKLQNFKRE